MGTFYFYFFDDICNKDVFCVIILPISCTSLSQIYHLIYETHMYKFPCEFAHVLYGDENKCITRFSLKLRACKYVIVTSTITS